MFTVEARTKARIHEQCASPPFPRNGIKSMLREDLLHLYSLLEKEGVNWRDVKQRLKQADSEVAEFVQHKSGQSAAALAAAQPMNAAFNVHPRAVDPTETAVQAAAAPADACVDKDGEFSPTHTAWAMRFVQSQ